MRRRMQGTLFAVTALLALVAWRIPATPLTLTDGSRLWFDGTSTLRSWSCTAPRIDAAIDADANAPAAVLAGQKAVKTVTLTFPVAQLDCDNKTMNGHMLKALNADQHKSIRFTLTGYELAKGANVSGTLQGTLALHGQTRPITVAAQFAPADGGLRVTGKYDLKMTEWGVEPPKLMMGTLKVGDVVNVQFDLLLQP
jgi:polyisoprenoid-binding protein YceI